MPYPILMYHQIRALPARTDTLRGLSVDPTDFRAQMTLLSRLGYRGVSMRELQPYLRGERSGKVFGITFDDGFRNVLQCAAPVLNDLGFTATCYFVVNRLGCVNHWDAHLDTRQSVLMNRGELLCWHASGHEIGSHTLDHVSLTQTASAEAQRQIFESRERLEDMTGEAVESFCYPYGDVCPEVRELVELCGYASATTTVRGLASNADDPYLLPRIGVVGGHNRLRFLYRYFRQYASAVPARLMARA
ncbi:polysaccharide deacetylase family protein [Paraburkholderia sabiae]|uniref:Polysaccharide deacetylase family protein n=1 Tax=Paraburkholderia sabiae TaxID=273251 RepID=A0ABU9QLY7_9BURK|nr:polysaccharide deacetylase family protein [Paraburkholderia sabiae]WJZ77314.1 polysaccharide deacetylase family protein [Paraburkholderia sabiae]CAD6547937.1 hypothetical protein LMG24235_04506 [Paraburkholderia sabiae]